MIGGGEMNGERETRGGRCREEASSGKGGGAQDKNNN